MSQPKLLVFIPTYNERDNVEPMCREIFGLKLDLDLMMMDDASPDGTGRVLDELKTKYPRLIVSHRAGKLGIGSAHLQGIQWAYDNQYDAIVTLDCDLTHSPQDIPKFIEKMKQGYAVIVGSRYLQSNSMNGWPLIRVLMTKTAHFLTGLLLGLNQDATGGFRLYNLRQIKPEVFSLVRSRGYSYFFESLYVLVNQGLKITQVPLEVFARHSGESKMTLREIGRSIRCLLTLWLNGRPVRL